MDIPGLLSDPNKRNRLAELLRGATGAIDAARPKVQNTLAGLLSGEYAEKYVGQPLDNLLGNPRPPAMFETPQNKQMMEMAMNLMPMGMIAYHGSPYKFDKFDSAHIGKGEGAQAYGHGLYFAESPDVARTYAAETAFKHGQKDIAEMMYSQKLGDAQAAAKALRREMDGMRWDRYPAGERAQYDVALAKLDAWAKSPPQAGQVYKVDLPDNAIARMLDWDKPLKGGQAQYAPIMRELGYMRPGDNGPRQYSSAVKSLGMAKGGFGSRSADVGGEVLWKALVDKHGGPDKAAAWLKSQGIPGIRYLDGGSRGAGSGTSNYVVFPGEENALLRILERNGVPTGQTPWKPGAWNH